MSVRDRIFKTGDMVKFRKGGPPTVGAPIVKKIFDDGRVALSWVSRTGLQMNSYCYAQDLELVPRPVEEESYFEDTVSPATP